MNNSAGTSVLEELDELNNDPELDMYLDQILAKPLAHGEDMTPLLRAQGQNPIDNTPDQDACDRAIRFLLRRGLVVFNEENYTLHVC